jgi:hypothetical protein
MRDQFSILAAILARWWHLVAFKKALNLLHRAMCVVTYWRITMAINSATFLESFVDCCLFFCCPGGCWGNAELVVTRCRHPGASSVALDLLNQAMPRASLQCARMTIEMARKGGVLSSLC